MRCNLNSIVLLVSAGVLLLAKSDDVPAQRVEVRTSNSQVEIVGSDVEQVTVGELSRAIVKYIDGRAVIEAASSNQGPITLLVPRRSSLDIATSNGAILVSGVEGRMQLITSNGAIRVHDAAGFDIHAHTSNGSIEIASLGGIHADVSAHTSNGAIHCDGGSLAGRRGENYIEGKIGGGGAKLDLQTSNGSITFQVAELRL
jgi:DUF4097 and DUF4098 domain-containing protein YvlB